MQIKTMLRQLFLDGDLELECPHGRIDFSASSQDRQVSVRISNNKTFRYLLSSLPGKGRLTALRKQLAYVAELPQALKVEVDGKTILEKKEGATPNLKYGYSALQWLRLKLGG